METITFHQVIACMRKLKEIKLIIKKEIKERKKQDITAINHVVPT